MNPIKHIFLLFCLFSTVSVSSTWGHTLFAQCHFGFSLLLFWMRNFTTVRFKCFCSSIFKACLLLFFFFHSPQKETLSLYNLSMFALLEMGKLMLNFCFACGTFKPRARRADDFQLQSGFFQEATEAAFNSRGGISWGRYFGTTHRTEKSLLLDSLSWRTGTLSLKKTPKEFFFICSLYFFLR